MINNGTGLATPAAIYGASEHHVSQLFTCSLCYHVVFCLRLDLHDHHR